MLLTAYITFIYQLPSSSCGYILWVLPKERIMVPTSLTSTVLFPPWSNTSKASAILFSKSFVIETKNKSIIITSRLGFSLYTIINNENYILR